MLRWPLLLFPLPQPTLFHACLQWMHPEFQGMHFTFCFAEQISIISHCSCYHWQSTISDSPIKTVNRGNPILIPREQEEIFLHHMEHSGWKTQKSVISAIPSDLQQVCLHNWEQFRVLIGNGRLGKGEHERSGLRSLSSRLQACFSRAQFQ